MNITIPDIQAFLECPQLYYKKWVQPEKPNQPWDILIFCLGRTLETEEEADWRTVSMYLIRKGMSFKRRDERMIRSYYKPYQTVYNYYRDLLSEIQSVVAVNFPYQIDIDNGNMVEGSLPVVMSSKTGYHLLVPFERDHHHSLAVRAMVFAAKRLTGSLPERVDMFGLGSENQPLVKKIFPTDEYAVGCANLLVDVAASMRRHPKYFNSSSCEACEHNKKCRID